MSFWEIRAVRQRCEDSAYWLIKETSRTWLQLEHLVLQLVDNLQLPTETTRSGDAEEAETRGHLQYWDSSLLWAPFEPSYRKAKHFSVFSLCTTDKPLQGRVYFLY
jgi:hypothetical protein